MYVRAMLSLTCRTPTPRVPFLEEDGDFNIKLHYVGWMVAGFFGREQSHPHPGASSSRMWRSFAHKTVIGSGASFWLIKKHLEFYTKPNQQVRTPSFPSYTFVLYVH